MLDLASFLVLYKRSIALCFLFVCGLSSAQDIPPSVYLRLADATAVEGSIVKAIVKVEFAPGLHGYQNPPTKDFMIPVVIKSGDGATLKSVDYPKGNIEMVAGELAAVYSGTVEFPIELQLHKGVGKKTISIAVAYQQCDESACFIPTTISASASITLTALQPIVKTTDSKKPVLKIPDPVVEVPVKVEPVTEVPQTVSQPVQESAKPASNGDGLLGWINNALEDKNWLLVLPLMLLVGLALCLTPCVFPMIPVTVSYFSSQTTDKKSARILMGVSYALGIALTYGAVGGISAAIGGTVGALFTKPWFAFTLAAFLIALALSMFDVYEIRLPSFLQKQLKGRNGVVGALIMGLLMGFAAAPCAGAVVGAVAVKVAEIKSVPIGIGLFGLVGFGMGLPFMVLASMSSGAKKLPKSGGWLKTVKAVLGFVVLTLAFGYLFQAIGYKSGEARTQIAWIAVYASFAGYLFFIDKSDSTRPVGIIKGLTGIALGFLIGSAWSSYGQIKFKEEFATKVVQGGGGSQVSATGIRWIPYNAQTFADAVASGKPIMIDGKADWCVQCKEIEERVFNTPDGLAALSNIYLMSVDWSTGTDPKYIEETKKRFNIVGLPNIVFMKPGGKDEFTVKDIKSVDELKMHLEKSGAQF